MFALTTIHILDNEICWQALAIDLPKLGFVSTWTLKIWPAHQPRPTQLYIMALPCSSFPAKFLNSSCAGKGASAMHMPAGKALSNVVSSLSSSGSSSDESSGGSAAPATPISSSRSGARSSGSDSVSSYCVERGVSRLARLKLKPAAQAGEVTQKSTGSVSAQVLFLQLVLRPPYTVL